MGWISNGVGRNLTWVEITTGCYVAKFSYVLVWNLVIYKSKYLCDTSIMVFLDFLVTTTHQVLTCLFSSFTQYTNSMWNRTFFFKLKHKWPFKVRLLRKKDIGYRRQQKIIDSVKFSYYYLSSNFFCNVTFVIFYLIHALKCKKFSWINLSEWQHLFITRMFKIN